MSIINMGDLPGLVDILLGQERFDTVERSDSTGSEASRLLAPPRWTLGVQSHVNMAFTEAAQWRATLLKLRGAVNVLAAYDPVRKQPEGTLRGSPRLHAPTGLAAGSTSMTLVGLSPATAGTAATLLTADRLQISTGVGTSQLVESVADATATEAGSAFSWTLSGPAFSWTLSGPAFTWVNCGFITVTFEPPTRIAFSADTAVTWSQPLAYYRMQGSPKWKYSTQARRREGGFAVDFLETFSA